MRRETCEICSCPLQLLAFDAPRFRCERCLSKPEHVCNAPGCEEPVVRRDNGFCRPHAQTAFRCITLGCRRRVPAHHSGRTCDAHGRQRRAA
jgi:hypothetical protein